MQSCYKEKGRYHNHNRIAEDEIADAYHELLFAKKINVSGEGEGYYPLCFLWASDAYLYGKVSYLFTFLLLVKIRQFENEGMEINSEILNSYQQSIINATRQFVLELKQ